MVKRSQITYGQLDGTLRTLGFSCRLSESMPPARLYDHPDTGASITLSAFPLEDFAYEYHLIGVRIMLDHYGMPDPTKSGAGLQSAS